MGSLMAGWASPVLGTKQASLARKTSFTREEIETYWKAKRDLEEEHSRAAAELAMQIKPQESPNTVAEETTVEPNASESPSVEEELEKVGSYKDWWTKSSWAFLNEPPIKRLEAANYKYTSQHQVAAQSISPINN